MEIPWMILQCLLTLHYTGLVDSQSTNGKVETKGTLGVTPLLVEKDIKRPLEGKSNSKTLDKQILSTKTAETRETAKQYVERPLAPPAFLTRIIPATGNLGRSTMAWEITSNAGTTVQKSSPSTRVEASTTNIPIADAHIQNVPIFVNSSHIIALPAFERRLQPGPLVPSISPLQSPANGHSVRRPVYSENAYTLPPWIWMTPTARTPRFVDATESSARPLIHQSADPVPGNIFSLSSTSADPVPVNIFSLSSTSADPVPDNIFSLSSTSLPLLTTLTTDKLRTVSFGENAISKTLGNLPLVEGASIVAETETTTFPTEKLKTKNIVAADGIIESTTGNDILPGEPVFEERNGEASISPWMVTSSKMTPQVGISSRAIHPGRTAMGIPALKNRKVEYGKPDTVNSTSFFTANTNASVPPLGAQNEIILGFCGFPPYNNREKCLRQNIFSDQLYLCEYEGGALAFSVIVGLLGAGIIISNCLLPIAVWRGRSPWALRTQYDYIKVSLAMADIIQGFVLLGGVLPSVTRLRNYTESEAVHYVLDDTNSVTAVLIGSLTTVSAQASLLHLAFLCVERFLAIKWPFWHTMRKTSSVIKTLVVLWMSSLFCAFIPAAFPQHFEYKFQPALLMHLMTLRPRPGSNQDLGLEGPVYAIITFLIPWVIMVIFCVMAGIVSYSKLKSRKRKFRNQIEEDGFPAGIVSAPYLNNNAPVPFKTTQKRRGLKPEISVLVTISIMIAAFTVTLLPFTVVMFLYVSKVLDCSNYTIPYVVSFYAGMLNCLANPIIYTLRDRRFRKALRSVFCSKSASVYKKKNRIPPSSKSTHF